MTAPALTLILFKAITGFWLNLLTEIGREPQYWIELKEKMVMIVCCRWNGDENTLQRVGKSSCRTYHPMRELLITQNMVRKAPLMTAWELARFDCEMLVLVCMLILVCKCSYWMCIAIHCTGIEKPSPFKWRLRVKKIIVADEGLYECYITVVLQTEAIASRTIVVMSKSAKHTDLCTVLVGNKYRILQCHYSSIHHKIFLHVIQDKHFE